MSFKEVTSLDADVTIAVGKKDKAGKPYPKQAEGYFLGSRTVESKRGDSKLHFLQTPKGNLGVWGTTDLNRKLAGVVPGAMIRITFTGMQSTPNGEMYKYKVEVDETNSIEVSAQSEAEDDGFSGGYDQDGTEDNSSEDQEEAHVDNESAFSASAAAAERKAKVQQLLAKGKKV